MMHSWLQDLRYALRALTKAPGFAAVALLTIALGVGANTAIFSLINSVLWRSLPYPDPEALVQVWPEKVFSEAMFSEVREQTTSFAGLTAHRGAAFTLIGDAESRVVYGAMVPVGHFSVLGVAPFLGRSFVPEEERAGGEDAVILSHAFWQRHFGGDEDVLGRRVRLGGRGHAERRVVGIMPADHRPLLPGIELWVPMAVDPESPAYTSAYGLRAVARLKPGVSVRQAAAEMHKLVPSFTTAHPTQFREIRFSPVDVVPLLEAMVGDFRPVLLLLFGAVALVLLIACSNVANLLLARGLGRQHEIALRMALGASRQRIVGQLLTESGLMSLMGGLLGLGAAGLMLSMSRDVLAEHIPRAVDVGLDVRVLAFTLVLALFAGLLFGALPALRVSRLAPTSALTAGRGNTQSAGQLAIKNLLVVAEIALALVLVVVAGLLLKSFWRLHQVDAGFDPDRLLAVRLQLPEGVYDEPESRAAYFADAFERLGSLPGVEAVGGVSRVPMEGGNAGIPYLVEGQSLPNGTASLVGNYRTVTPGYFDALGLRLERGRLFDRGDHADAEPVVVINEAMARRHWPDEDPIGKRFLSVSSGEPLFTVIGVVSDIQETGLAAPPHPSFYVAAAQDDWQISAFLLRTAGDPASLRAGVESMVRGLDERVPILQVKPMSELIADSLGNGRFFISLFSAFAAVALLLGIVGVYGVMSFAMRQRRREMGVRIALGATALQILSFAMRRAMAPVVIGVAVGVALAYLLTRALKSILFEVAPHDPVVLVAVAILLTVVGALASFLPARRASRIHPVDVLRSE